MGLGSDGCCIPTLRPSFILYPKPPFTPPQGPLPSPALGIRLQEVPPFPQHTQLYLSERNQAKLQTAVFLLVSGNTSDRDPQTSHPPHVPFLQRCKKGNGHGHTEAQICQGINKQTCKKRGRVGRGPTVCAVLSWSTFSSVDHLHLKACVMSPCSEQQQFNMRETRVESAIFQQIGYQQQQLAYCNISLRLNK